VRVVSASMTYLLPLVGVGGVLASPLVTERRYFVARPQCGERSADGRADRQRDSEEQVKRVARDVRLSDGEHTREQCECEHADDESVDEGRILVVQPVGDPCVCAVKSVDDACHWIPFPFEVAP